MKKLILFLFFTGLFISRLQAGDAVTLMSDSKYYPTNTTITISSHAVTTIAAVSGYRIVYIGDTRGSGVTSPIFYRIDDSTISIPTYGWIIPTNSWGSIESNGLIYLQLGAGATSITTREMIIRRK